jgi:opacity protein-like surface antigen
MKKLLLIISLIPLCSFGQGDAMTSVMYSIAIPMGKSSDFIDETSFRGFAVTGDYFLNDEWSLGFSTGVQTFYGELGSQTYELETLTVTGEEFRYINMIPAIMMAKYHFSRYGVMTPHVGMGAGFHWVEERREFAGFQFQEDSFRFGIQPEVGFGLEISPSTDLLFVSTYHQSFKSKNLQEHSFLAFQLGLRWLP